MSEKLNFKGPFAGEKIKADIKWVTDALFKRTIKLNYSNLNLDIKAITLPENRIILDNLTISKAITVFRRDYEGWGGSGNNGYKLE